MFLTVNAQDLTGKRSELREISQTVAEFYQKGDLKAASETAQQVLDLTIEIYGTENRETAVAYNNLGTIYQTRKKYDEAAGYFQKALRIYQLKPDENEVKIAGILESLGVALTLEGETDEAEKIIEDAIKTAENAFGSESMQIVQYLKTALSFYIYAKKYEKAEDLFARQYNLALQIYGKDNEELENISDNFFCYSRRFDSKEAKEKNRKFKKSTNRENQSDKNDVEIINGKALSFPMPIVPGKARQIRARGQISVKIMIDEEGNVISAKSICGGNQDLQEASEKAAMKAKFQPTTLDGKPIQVSGVVTYNYQ